MAMSIAFAAPMWLLWLLPWAALSLWLMLGRRDRFDVPFIELWQTENRPTRKMRASLRPPPFGLACLLLAMLAGLLAAARPAFLVSSQHLRLVIDRGVAMSSPATDATIHDALRGFQDVELIQVPGPVIHDVRSLAPACGVDTRGSFPTRMPVLTTQALSDAIQLPSPKNVGIVHV